MAGVGTAFLVRTIEMTELILNTVALDVVLHFDEMLFMVLIPEGTMIAIHKTFPFPVRRIRRFIAQLVPVFNWAL
jgi:hypothetical protein